jgi:hypothetical protein
MDRVGSQPSLVSEAGVIGKQLASLVVPWLKKDPGLAYRNRMVFRTPVGLCLAGVLFESRPHDADGLYLDTVVQPLYIPSEIVTFTVADALGLPRTLWTFRPGINRDQRLHAMLRSAFDDLLPRALSLASPDALASKLWPPDRWSNLHIVEALAYSLLLAGDVGRARKALAVLTSAETTVAGSPTWNAEISARAGDVASLLAGGDAAAALLLAWRDQSIGALRLARSPINVAEPGGHR